MTYLLDVCALIASLNAVIVTKDPEIKPVEKAESLSVFWIQ